MTMRMKWTPAVFGTMIAVLWTAVCARSAAAGPREELLRLVDDDAALVVVVQNLRELSQSAHERPIFKALRETSFGKALLQSDETRQLLNLESKLLDDLKLKHDDLVNDILGDCAVFSYRKGRIAGKDQEEAVLFIRARDSKHLSHFVDRINLVQKGSGEVTGVTVDTDSKPPISTRSKASRETDYYILDGTTLVFTESHSAVRRIQGRMAGKSAASSAVLDRMKRLGIDDAPVSAVINPRSLDSEFKKSLEETPGPQRTFLLEFGKYWSAVNGIGMYLDWRRDAELGLAIDCDKAKLPKSAAVLLAEAGKKSPLWTRIPNDALFAWVMRMRAAAVIEAVREFLPPDDQAKASADLEDALRPILGDEGELKSLRSGLGADWGIWMTAPSAGAKSWVPEMVFALGTTSDAAGATAGKVAVSGLDFLARLACVRVPGLRVKQSKVGEATVTSLIHPTAFPDGFQPSFALKGGYVLVTGRPETIGQFQPPTAPPESADEFPLIRMSAKGWVNYLTAQEGPLTEWLASKTGEKSDTVARRLRSLTADLASFDRLELVQRTAADRVTFLLRLAPSKADVAPPR